MAFQRLFDNPLYGDHSPLVMGWSDDQLWPIVDQLAELLPPNLTDGMLLAIASCSRSIVAENKLTGLAVHYARGKEAYRLPGRYRCGDPRHSWHYITRSMDTLEQIGLISQVLGKWCPGRTGFQSVAWATEKLMALLGPLIDVSEHRGIPSKVETIVLRDGADKTEIDYTETAATVTMREQVQVLNDHLAQLELRRRGQKFDIPIGRRIFNGSFDRGGRFYCHGPSFQNMSARQRRELELIIDGTAHPLVEVDYSNLHIRMAYSEAGRRTPHGDQYTIDGFDRGLVKVAVNTLLNAPTTNSGILAITEELRYNPDLGAVNGIKSSNRNRCRALAKRVVAAIHHKHRRIKSYFGSDCGARFQRQDSDMAIEVMTRMVQRTGRCPLPVHDSFLVPEIDADILSQTMIEVAREYGLHLDLKDSRSSRDKTAGRRAWTAAAPTVFPTSFLVSPEEREEREGTVPRTEGAGERNGIGRGRGGRKVREIPSRPLPPPSLQLEVTTADLRVPRRPVLWNKASRVARKPIVRTRGSASGPLRPQPRPLCHGPPVSDTHKPTAVRALWPPVHSGLATCRTEPAKRPTTVAVPSSDPNPPSNLGAGAPDDRHQISIPSPTGRRTPTRKERR